MHDALTDESADPTLCMQSPITQPLRVGQGIRTFEVAEFRPSTTGHGSMARAMATMLRSILPYGPDQSVESPSSKVWYTSRFVVRAPATILRI